MTYQGVLIVGKTTHILVTGEIFQIKHCIKSVQIRSFFWSVFSRIRTEYGEILYISSVFSPNAGKYEPEKTPYLDTFHAVYQSGAHFLVEEFISSKAVVL